MARKSQSLIAAAAWVQDLMDLLTVADHFNKRTTDEAIKLLRAGCAKHRLSTATSTGTRTSAPTTASRRARPCST